MVLKDTEVLRPGEKFDHWVAIPVTADSPVFFKSRESREGAAVSLIYSDSHERSRIGEQILSWTLFSGRSVRRTRPNPAY